VLVTRRRRTRILRLRDTDGDGTADQATTFADEGNGLNIPFGMAFTATHFYVGNTNAVRRWPYAKGQSRRLDGAASSSRSCRRRLQPALDAERPREPGTAGTFSSPSARRQQRRGAVTRARPSCA
jgi:hypothetical protein